MTVNVVGSRISRECWQAALTSASISVLRWDFFCPRHQQFTAVQFFTWHVIETQEFTFCKQEVQIICCTTVKYVTVMFLKVSFRQHRLWSQHNVHVSTRKINKCYIMLMKILPVKENCPWKHSGQVSYLCEQGSNVNGFSLCEWRQQALTPPWDETKQKLPYATRENISWPKTPTTDSRSPPLHFHNKPTHKQTRTWRFFVGLF